MDTFDWRFIAIDFDDLTSPASTAPNKRRSRRPPDLHELTAPPKENEDRAGDGDCGLRPEQLSPRARSPGRLSERTHSIVLRNS